MLVMVSVGTSAGRVAVLNSAGGAIYNSSDGKQSLVARLDQTKSGGPASCFPEANDKISS